MLGLGVHIRAQDRVDPRLVAALATEPFEKIRVQLYRHGLFPPRDDHAGFLPEALVGSLASGSSMIAACISSVIERSRRQSRRAIMKWRWATRSCLTGRRWYLAGFLVPVNINATSAPARSCFAGSSGWRHRAAARACGSAHRRRSPTGRRRGRRRAITAPRQPEHRPRRCALSWP